MRDQSPHRRLFSSVTFGSLECWPQPQQCCSFSECQHSSRYLKSPCGNHIVNTVSDKGYPHHPILRHSFLVPSMVGRTRTECATPSVALAAIWPRRYLRSNHMTVRRRTSGRQALSCLLCSRATPRSRWQSRRTGGSGLYQAGAMIASGLLIFEAAPIFRHLRR